MSKRIRHLSRLRAAVLLPVLGLLLSGCAASRAVPTGELLNVEQMGLLDASISETSGLAFGRDAFWTHNDSGDGPSIYRLASNGEVVQSVELLDAVSLDWEEMAASDSNLYVFDCGNNIGHREWMQAYALSWSDLGSGQQQVPSRLLEFRFADAERVHAAYEHDNDCEAAAWVDGEIWLFTKNWSDLNTRLYRLDPNAEGRQALFSEHSFPVNGLITAADYDQQTQTLALLGYTKSRLSPRPFIWMLPVESSEPVWSDARFHWVSPAGQWEAITWHQGDLWLTRESSLLGQAWLGRVRISGNDSY